MGDEDGMQYERMMQDALRGVLRRILERAAAPEGLPQPHHLFLQFRTDYPGVDIPARLKEEYPQEMTIVFKSHYWDMQVTEQTFEVSMSFQQKAERLIIPIAAVTQVVDPSADFGLHFVVQLPDAPPSLEVARAEPATGENVVSLDAFRKKPN